MLLVAIDGMLPLPAGAAEVLEALEVPAKVGPNDTAAHGAEGVLQVGVYLYLKREREEGRVSGSLGRVQT